MCGFAETGLWRRPWLAHFVLLKGSTLYVLKRVESKYPTKVLSLTKAQVRQFLPTFDLGETCMRWMP